MREVIRLVQDIRSFLSGVPGSPSAEALAPAYAEFREQAANRLEACAAMLEKGSEYQVLQLAETDPPLLDLVAHLTFAEEPRWVAYCGENGLAAPKPMDAKAVQALNNIYNKGISANSPLYRDYRAAVSSRNDDRAYQIIRSIARLNSSDANAQAELERLGNKKMLAKLEELKPLLAANDKEAVTAVVEELDALAPQDKLARHEVYNEAAAIRKKVLRRKGDEEAASLLNASEQQKEAGDWKGVSVNVTRIRTLEAEREIVFAPEQAGRLTALENYVEKQRADAREQVAFNRELAAFSNHADKIDTRLLTGATLTLKEAEQWEAGFAQHWKKVELYQRSVPSGEMGRLQGIGAAIHGEVARLRRAKAAKKFSVAAATALFLCAGAWAGFVAWRAYQYVQQLDDLQSRGMAVAAGKLVEEIPATAPWGAMSIPALRAKSDEVRQWAKNEQAHLEQTESLLAELEKADANQYADWEPPVLRQKVATAAENVGHLAADMTTSKDRLAQIQNKVDQHFTTLREKIAHDTQQQLTRLSKKADGLSYEQPSTDLTKNLAAIDPKLKELEKHLETDIPELRLPPETEVAIRKLRSQIDPFLQENESLRNIRKAMADADTLDAYRSALTQYSKLKAVEGGGASSVLANFPTPDGLASKILFSGDEAAWEAVKKDKTVGATFRPVDVLNNELTELLSLRDDPLLDKIWEVIVTSLQGRPNRTLWCKGKPDESNNGLHTRWAGSYYDPATSPLRAVFANETIMMSDFGGGRHSGDMVSSQKPSSNQGFMASLNLTRVTDPNGDHYETSLLAVLDDVIQAKEGSALARAFVFQKLCHIIKIRPYEWGLHYCPLLTEDLAKLDALLGNHTLHDDDWMVPDQQKRLESTVTQFLKSAAAHGGYFKTASEYRTSVTAVRDAGIKYAGFIDDHHEAHLKSKGIEAPTLWTIAEKDSAPIRLALENGHAKPEDLKTAQKWSPLFLIAYDHEVIPATPAASGDAAAPSSQASPGDAAKNPAGAKDEKDKAPSTDDQAKTDRETMRRNARVQEAEAAYAKGNALIVEVDYEGAFNEFKTALDLLPITPATQNLRDAALARYCDASVGFANLRVKNGRVAEARVLLNDALKLKPGQAAATKLLNELAGPTVGQPSSAISSHSMPKDPKEIWKLKMDTIIFPSIKVSGASIEELVEFLKLKSKDLDVGERDPRRKGVNIVLRRGNTPSTAQISLDLVNIPLTEAVRYVTELAGMSFEIKEEGVVIQPLGAK